MIRTTSGLRQLKRSHWSSPSPAPSYRRMWRCGAACCNHGHEGNSLGESRQRIQCHEKSAFNTQLWKSVLWWSKEMSKIRHPPALRRAGLTGFGIQRSFPNPLTVYLSIRRAQSSELSTHASTPPEPKEVGRNPRRRNYARGLQPDIRPRRSAQPTCQIWGCWALGNPGNKRPRLPAPGETDTAGGRGLRGPVHCQEAAAVPGARTATPAPN